MKDYKTKYADFLGILSSVLCIIHCLIFPFIFLWFNYQHQSAWHMLDYVFILLAGMAVYGSSKHNPFIFLKIAFWLSYLLFAVSLILHETLWYSFYLSLVASVSLVVCHLFNFSWHVRQEHTYSTTLKQ